MNSLGVFDITRVQPLLHMIKHGHGDGGDHGNLLVVILEDEHHVKVLKTELDTFKVDKLNVFQGRNKGRPRGEVNLEKQVWKGQCELFNVNPPGS